MRSLRRRCPGLEVLSATGLTLEACRINLSEAVEDWLLLVSVAKGLPIPSLDGVELLYRYVLAS